MGIVIVFCVTGPSTDLDEMTEPIRFSVSIPNPDDHLIAVRMEVPELGREESVELCMPVWSPGSYKVREYSRHVQNIRAEDADDRERQMEKVDKATWRVDCDGTDRLSVQYEVYAHRLNVREKHVDDSHAFYQPTALYLYPKGRLDSPARLEVNPPYPDWKVYCGLQPVDGGENRWRAPDFDTLFDMPVEMGDHDEVVFEVDGVEHTMAFWGEGNWDRERLERDVPEIVSANASLFDGLPYDEYTFVTLLSGGAYGGLEHRNSTALIYPQNQFGEAPDAGDSEPPIEDDDYLNFLSLVAHEHFHVWNVKRIFPKAIEEFDYQRENYVPDIWTIEGITSFYDRVALLRSGLVDADRFLEFFADRIRKYESIPGRHVDSLREAGMDAWIKLYRPDENRLNSTVSYYLKGSLVALLLDLRIRRETDGERSLDDLLQHLWETFGRTEKRGYPDGYYEKAASQIAGTDLSRFFDRYVRGTDEFDWEEALDPLGLTLERSTEDDTPNTWLGIHMKSAEGGVKVSRVRNDGPAHEAGIYPGDEIIAVGDWKTGSSDQLEERLDLFEPDDVVDVQLFRRNRLLSRAVSLTAPPEDDYAIVRQTDITDAQRKRLEQWLGTDEVTTAEASENE